MGERPVSINFVGQEPRRSVEAPRGIGQRPGCSYFSALCPANATVRWTLDANGWAIGYELWEKANA